MKIGIGGHIFQMPPLGYGGVERVAAWWCDELKRRGHYVRIFGHPGSTAAHDALVPVYASSDYDQFGPAYRQHGLGLDVIHHNSDAMPSEAMWTTSPHGSHRPFVHTVHACVWHRRVPCPVFLSANQARWFGYGPNAPVIVHNGFPIDRFAVETEKEGFYLWCGSLRGSKAPDMAVQLAEETGAALIIIGPIQDGKYADYPERFPRGRGRIQYLGEMGDERLHYFRKAKALLYTCAPEWMEGMCLVLCEAMLSGTPVIGLVTPNNTIVSEIVSEGGLACESYDAMRDAIQTDRAASFSPDACRANGERFSIARAVDQYLELYEAVMRGDRW